MHLLPLATYNLPFFFSSWGYEDELPWAEIWLHRAKKGNSWPAGVKEVGYAYDGFSWDNKQGGLAVSILVITIYN